MLGRARATEADQLSAGQQRMVAALAVGRIAEAHAKDPVDIALQHGRGRVEPERIDEHEDVGVGDFPAFLDDIGAGRKAGMIRQLAGVQKGANRIR